MDYEKLSGDRMGETGKSIRKRVQVRAIFSNNGLLFPFDVIRNADVSKLKSYIHPKNQDTC